MRTWLAESKRNQAGQVIPIVLIVLALGGLIVLPMLDYLSTSLESGEVIEKKVDALYAADAGIEDALFVLKNPERWPENFPYSYTLMEGSSPAIINGMQVNITLGLPSGFMGEPIQAKNPNAPDTQTQNLELGDIEVTGSGPIYTCTFTITNVPLEHGSNNIWILIVKAFFQDTVSYVNNSTKLDGNTFNPQPPSNNTRLLKWDGGLLFNIMKGQTRSFSFQVNGSPGGISSPLIAITANQESIGTIMGLGLGGASFLRITSTATDENDNRQQAQIVTDAIMGYTFEGSNVIIGEIRILDWIIDHK